MYDDLKKLKNIKGFTDEVKRRIEKTWTWGLITDEQFEELMEIKKTSENVDVIESIDMTTESVESTENLSE